MKNIVLSEYVKSGLFLEQRTKNMKYDCIITQYPFVSETSVSCEVIVLDEKNIHGSLAHALVSCTHPLVILESVALPSFLSLGDEKKDITIVNLASGYTSIGTVTAPFLQDISLAYSLGYDVYEPYDSVSLTVGLEKGGKTYIRLTTEILPDILPLGYQDIVALKTRVTSAGTSVLFTGSFLATAARVGDILEKESSGIHTFILPHLTFDSFSLIKEYLEGMQVIVVSDQQGGGYEQYIKAKLYDIGIRIRSLRFLYPLYEEMTTVLPEYQSQQLAMDTDGLVMRIKALL